MLIGPKIEGTRGALALDDLQETLGATAGAGFEEASELNPLRTLLRMGDLSQGVYPRAEPRVARTPAGRRARQAQREPLSRLLSEDEANQRFAAGDLKFAEPVREEVARLKNEFKLEEIKRRDIIARGPGGALGFLAPLSGGLAASLLDPLNIASAFIPVVAPTRFAAMTGRLGLTRARLARGAIEGAVGTAVLEPLVLAGARAIEADFGITDAMLDIVFGTVLGGGLHVGVGRLADYVGRQKPEVRRAALRSAVAQAAEGRTVNVEPVFRAELLGTTSRLAFEPDVTPRIEGLPAAPKDVDAQVDKLIADIEASTAEVKAFPDPREGLIDVEATVESAMLERNRRKSLAEARLGALPEGLAGVPGETITGVSIRTQDGSIFTSTTHAEALEKAQAVEPDLEIDLVERGFVTSEGRFVDKNEAVQIVERSGQVPNADREFGLDSEQLINLDRTPETPDQIVAREHAPERDAASDFAAADEAERVLERSIDDPSQIDAKAEADQIEAELREDLGLPEAGAEVAEELPTELPLSTEMVETIATRAETQGEVTSVLASNIEVDAALFQFKADTDVFGVGERLQGITEWDQRRAGVVTIYESIDGRRFIVDGHQRLGLAKRLMANDPSQEIRLNAFVDREADGVTPSQARIIAAGVNIAEGSGTAIDAAKILREVPESLPALPPRSALVQTAQGLVNLGDEAFGMVINELVQPTHAAVVGRMVTDEPFQVALLRLLAETEPASVVEAESIVRQGIAAGFDRRTEATLFGEEEIVDSLFKERARVLSRALTALRKDKATFSTLVKRENDILGAGNVLDRASNVERLTDNAKALSALQALANRKGPISDALTEAARGTKGGGSFRGATTDFVKTLRKAIREGALDRPEEGGGRGIPESPGDNRSQPRSAESANVTVEDEAGINKIFTGTKEHLEAGPEPVASEPTQTGEQAVIPGAERIRDRELAERRGEGLLRSEVEQKPATEGLFDVSGRQQQDLNFGNDLVDKADSYGRAARAAALCLSRKP